MKKNIVIFLSMLVLLCVISICDTYVAEENIIEDAKNSIVEIQSGVIGSNGKFYQMKYGSGFLISNEDGATYIVTSCNIAQNSNDDIQKYCETQNIDTENSQMSNIVRIVVKGDVAVEANVVVKSEAENYCILSTENVVSEKTALKLGDASNLKANAVLYALGFPENPKDIAYLSGDVEIFYGILESVSVEDEKIKQLKHTMNIHEGSTGGPLLDEDGYVLGMNFGNSPYSVAINEIAEVLDNFSIYYGSRLIDENYIALENLYNECMELAEGSDYKYESIQQLQEVLQDVEQVLREDAPTAENLENALYTLTKIKEDMIPKTSQVTIYIYILAGCIVVLTIWLIVLLVLNHKDAKAKKSSDRNAFANSTESVAKTSDNSIQISKNEKPQKLNNVQPQEEIAKTTLTLYRVSNKQVIPITGKKFYIGSNPEMSNYCVVGNNTISRRHAVIEFAGHGYYFSDLNSSNGSRVNGKQVQGGQRISIKQGDEIILSNERFLVR